MTITKKTIISMIALGMAAVAPVKAQTLAVSQGDVLLSFYTSSGSTSGTTTYIYNLGQGSNIFNNPISLSIIANLNDELTAAFGSGWASDSTLKMGLVGGFDNSASSETDPARTLYYSKGLATYAPGSTSAPTLAPALHRSTATAVGTYLIDMNGVITNGAVDGAIVNASDAGVNTPYTSFNPPTGTSYFGTGINLNTSFGAGTIGTGAGGYGVEAGLDLYRMVYQGSTQYVGTFTIDTDGNLRVEAVPEPSTYALIAVAGLAWMFFLRRRKAQTL